MSKGPKDQPDRTLYFFALMLWRILWITVISLIGLEILFEARSLMGIH